MRDFKRFGGFPDTYYVFLHVVSRNVAVESCQYFARFRQFPFAGKKPRRFWYKEENDTHCSNHRPLCEISLVENVFRHKWSFTCVYIARRKSKDSESLRPFRATDPINCPITNQLRATNISIIEAGGYPSPLV